MTNRSRLLCACLAFWLSGAALPAQESGEDLRKALGDVELMGAWIYDDLDSGFAAARKTGKPLLIVFR